MGAIESLKTLRSKEQDYRENIFRLNAKIANNAKSPNKVARYETDRGEWESRLAQTEKDIKELLTSPPPPILEDEKGEYIRVRYVVCGNPECEGDIDGSPYRGKIVGSKVAPWRGAKCPICHERLGVRDTKKVKTGDKK